MGLLKGKPATSTSTSVSGSAQPWAQPYATGAAQDVISTVNANKPNLDALTKNVTGQLTGLQAAGAGLGKTGASASNWLGGELAGKNMNSNPYLAHVLSTLNSGISDSVNSQFEGAGRYGSGAYVGELAKQIGNADSGVLYGNYNDDLNRQLAAAQQAQAAQAQNSQQQLTASQLASQIPYAGSESLANSLGALFNGGTQNSNSTGQRPGLLDYAAQAAAAFAASGSDRRLKTNIKRVGEWDAKGDGLGKYEWNWKADPKGQKVIGVVADEVEKLRPWAFVPNFRGDGMAGVNYAAL